MSLLGSFIDDLLLRVKISRQVAQELLKTEESKDYVDDIIKAIDLTEQKINELVEQIEILTGLLQEYREQIDILMALNHLIEQVDDLDKRFKIHIEYLMLELKTHQLYLKQYPDRMRALYAFANYLCNCAGLNLSILPIPGIYRYAFIPFRPHNNERYVMSIPFLDINLPRKWVLLAHEVGHILWNYTNSATKKRILKELAEKVMDLSPDFDTGVKYYSLWERKWLPELFADATGVSLAGPSFTYQFVYEVFTSTPRSEWKRRDLFHPPPDIRMELQLNLLQNQEIWKEEFENLKTLWEQFSEQTIDEELAFPFDSEINNFVLNSIMKITRPPKAIKYWSEVIELKEKLLEGSEDRNPLVVLAIATLSPHWVPPERIYKVIAGD